jgi:hypothetical protein
LENLQTEECGKEGFKNYRFFSGGLYKGGPVEERGGGGFRLLGPYSPGRKKNAFLTVVSL